MKEIEYEPGALGATFFEEVKELCRLMEVIEGPEVRRAVDDVLHSLGTTGSPEEFPVTGHAVTATRQLPPTTEVIVKGFRDGLTWQEIATFLGRTADEVEKTYSQLV